MKARTFASLAAAVATVITLSSCGGGDDKSAKDSTSSTTPAADGDSGQIGTPIVKDDATLTITNLTVGGECKYGPLEGQELAEGGKILQTEGTFTNSGDKDRTLLNPSPLNADGTKTVVPESIEYSTPCHLSDSEDGTINWYEGGEAGATRNLYNVQVIPNEATAVEIGGKVFQLPAAQ